MICCVTNRFYVTSAAGVGSSLEMLWLARDKNIKLLFQDFFPSILVSQIASRLTHQIRDHKSPLSLCLVGKEASFLEYLCGKFKMSAQRSVIGLARLVICFCPIGNRMVWFDSPFGNSRPHQIVDTLLIQPVKAYRILKKHVIN